MLIDGFDQALDLLIEPIQVFLNVGAHRVPGDLQAVTFLGPQGLQRIQTQHERAQGDFGFASRLPGRRMAFGAKFGDEARIDGIGFGPG